MKIDLNRPILDYDGSPITQQKQVPIIKCEKCGNETTLNYQALENLIKQYSKQVTFKEVVLGAINTLTQKDELNATDKGKIFDISNKIATSKGNVDLPQEDWTLIKQRIGNISIPLIVGRFNELLGD